ncbi:MAG: hypothetical protein Q9204_005464 [Flavoplaca sp. TL-2023a]
MKYINIVPPLALVFVTLSSCITANPVTSSADEGLAKNNLQARQEQGEEWNFPDPPVTLPPVRIEDILNLASNLFASTKPASAPKATTPQSSTTSSAKPAGPPSLAPPPTTSPPATTSKTSSLNSQPTSGSSKLSAP